MISICYKSIQEYTIRIMCIYIYIHTDTDSGTWVYIHENKLAMDMAKVGGPYRL